MDSIKQAWNNRQQELQTALEQGDAPQAITLFLDQHAQVHSIQLSQTSLHSFEDEAWAGLTEDAVRQIPSDCDHSIVWIAWHLSRIEDVTMNVLLQGDQQLFVRQGWEQRLTTFFKDTGNAMSHQEIALLSSTVNVPALRMYRHEVGRRTRKLVQKLSADQLSQPVQADRLQRLLDEGAVLPESDGLLDYWGGLTGAGLLLMPPTRHSFEHWDEAREIRQKLARMNTP